MRSQLVLLARAALAVPGGWPYSCTTPALLLPFQQHALQARLAPELRPSPGAQQRRQYADELRILQQQLSESQYGKLADETMDRLQEVLEAYVEDCNLEGGDIVSGSGVLTVKLGKHGTFVINKQTPNRQIWLSSPVSGPFRFDYVQGRWVYHRTGQDLYRQLEKEMEGLTGRQLKLDARAEGE